MNTPVEERHTDRFYQFIDRLKELDVSALSASQTLDLLELMNSKITDIAKHQIELVKQSKAMI